MVKLLLLIANPIHTFLLRSAIHGLVSHRMMLLTFHGRKSGRRYCFPVYYSRIGDDIRFFTDRSGRWWLNLLRGTWVRIRLRGADYDGVVEHVPASHRRMVEGLLAFDPALSEQEAEQFADSKVMFQVRLQTEAQRLPQRVAGVS